MGSRGTEDRKEQQAQPIPELGPAVRVTEMAVAQGGFGIKEFVFAFRVGEGSLWLMGAMLRRGEGKERGRNTMGPERNAAGEMSLRGEHTAEHQTGENAKLAGTAVRQGEREGTLIASISP